MTVRKFEEVYWDVFPEVFVARRASRWRLESFSLSGYPSNPEVACIWHAEANPRPQRLSGLMNSLLDAHVSVAQERTTGWGPALVAGLRAGADTHHVAVVYEPFSAAEPTPELVIHSSFNGLSGTFYGSPKGVYARSIVALPPQALDQKPYFLATLWPHRGPRFDWGAGLLDQADLSGYPEAGPVGRAFAAVSQPWLVSPTWELVSLPEGPVLPDIELPGQVDPRLPPRAPRRRPPPIVSPKVLTVWRDRIFDPWSSEPFSRDVHRERFIRCDAAVSADAFNSSRAQWEADGFELLAVGTTGGGPILKRYAALYVQRGADALGRKFFVQGLGNARQEFDVPPTVTEEAPAVPWTIETPILPLDRAMWVMMAQDGLRVGQVAIVRNKKLAWIRSCTNAELGYPIATASTRMRWGSCSKAIDATALSVHYMSEDATDFDVGLGRGFAAELGIDGNDPVGPIDPNFIDLDLVTVEMAIKHRTGIAKDAIGQQSVYEAVHGPVPAGDAFWDLELKPGNMRTALEKWSQPLVTDLTFAYAYQNYVYIALSELWGKVGLEGGAFEAYVDAAKLVLPAEQRQRETMLVGEGYQGSVDNLEAPQHSARIWVAPDPYNLASASGPPPYEHISYCYNGNPGFGAGAGWWALSALEMAGVLRQMSTGENEKWPTPLQRMHIRRRGLGWSVRAAEDGFNFTFRDSAGADPEIGFDLPPAPVWVMFKDGAGNGCRAFIVHVFQEGGSSLEICVAFNGDAIGDRGSYIVTTLLAAAQVHEDLDLWAPIDLFGVP